MTEDARPGHEARLPEILLSSIAAYEALYALNADLLSLDMQCNPEIIEDFCGRLNAQQLEVQKHDLLLSSVPKQAFPNNYDSLLLRRQELLQRVFEQNRLISDKIHGMMSLISAEVSQIRGGMTAMSGYRGGREHKGNVLKGAC